MAQSTPTYKTVGNSKTVGTPIVLIERWLENTLSFSLHKLSHSNASAMAQMKIDRASLTERGLTKAECDRIYRSFFVYTNGVHEIMEGSDPALSFELWDAFMRLLENCDPNHSELYSIYLQQKHDESLAEAIKEQKSELERVKDICEQLSQATAQSELKAMALQNKANQDKLYFESMFDISKNKLEALKEELAGEKAVRQALESAVSKATSNATACGRKIVELSAVRDSQSERIKEFTDKCAELQQQVTHLTRTLATSEVNLKSASEVRDVSKLKIRAMQQEGVELRAEISKKDNELHLLTDKLADKEEIIQTFAVTCVELNNSMVSVAHSLERYYKHCADDMSKQSVLYDFQQTIGLARLSEPFILEERARLEKERVEKAKVMMEVSLPALDEAVDVAEKKATMFMKMNRNAERVRSYVSTLDTLFLSEVQTARFVDNYDSFLQFIQDALRTHLMLEFQTEKLHSAEQQLVASGFVGNVYEQTSSKLQAMLNTAESNHIASLHEFHQILEEQKRRFEGEAKKTMIETEKKYSELAEKLKDVQLKLKRKELQHETSCQKLLVQQNTLTEMASTKFNKQSELVSLQTTLKDKNEYINSLIERLTKADSREKALEKCVESLRAVLSPLHRNLSSLGENLRTAVHSVSMGERIIIRPSPEIELIKTVSKQIQNGQLDVHEEWSYIVGVLLESTIALKLNVDAMLPLMNETIALKDEVKKSRGELFAMKTYCAKEKRRISKFYEDQIAEMGLAETFSFYDKLESGTGTGTLASMKSSKFGSVKF